MHPETTLHTRARVHAAHAPASARMEGGGGGPAISRGGRSTRLVEARTILAKGTVLPVEKLPEGEAHGRGADDFRRVAQWLAHPVHTREVDGSTPSPASNSRAGAEINELGVTQGMAAPARVTLTRRVKA